MPNKNSPIQDFVRERLAKGDKIGLYPTGERNPNGEYYRFESDKKVVNEKTFWAMFYKGEIKKENLVEPFQSSITGTWYPSMLKEVIPYR